MTSSRDPVILVLLIIVILVAVGYVMSTSGGKDEIINIPLHPVISPTSTPSVKQTLSIYDQPSGYWIKIDPIGDKRQGDIFSVNASTNLSVGEEILVQVYQADFHTDIRRIGGEFHGIESTEKVMPGINEINTISFIVNSSELYPDPRKYRFSMAAINENATGEVLFNITLRKTR